MYALTFVHPGKTWQTAPPRTAYPYQQSHLSCEVLARHTCRRLLFRLPNMSRREPMGIPHLAGSKTREKSWSSKFLALLFITLVPGRPVTFWKWVPTSLDPTAQPGMPFLCLPFKCRANCWGTQPVSSLRIATRSRFTVRSQTRYHLFRLESVLRFVSDTRTSI